MTPQKQRIWELDALRGICILGMIAVHLILDLAYFSDRPFSPPVWFLYLQRYGYLLFVLLSGVCAVLARKSFQRGQMVFFAGLLVSYVTMFFDFVLGYYHLRVWFGILHMLGVCMMLYPPFRRLPVWLVALLGVAFVLLGIWLRTQTVTVNYLFPLGLRPERFFTGSDYFPLFPGLGWFLLGTVIGKTAYGKGQSLLLRINAEFCILKFLRRIGQNSLLIYLLHQPILFLLIQQIYA